MFLDIKILNILILLLILGCIIYCIVISIIECIKKNIKIRDINDKPPDGVHP